MLISYINDLESIFIRSDLISSNDQFVSEKGEVERWKGGTNKEKVTEEIKADFLDFRP